MQPVMYKVNFKSLELKALGFLGMSDDPFVGKIISAATGGSVVRT